MSSAEEEDVLVEILKEVDLLAFLPRIRNNLNATRISHFDYVKREDLEGIGMSRPAARRLLDAVKKRTRRTHPSSFQPQSYLSAFFTNIVGQKRRQALEGRPTFYNSDIDGLRREVSDNSNGTIERGCLISRQDILLLEKLGQGTFGEVWKGEWKRENGTVKPVAVKMLRNNALDLPGAFGDFVKEVEAMIGLQHPNLIQLYGVNLSAPYMIIQELAPLGSLLDRLRKEASLTSVLLIFDWSKQIAHGMTYLEKQRLVHRDLAARNIFLSAIDKVKIGDFGLMKSISEDAECYTMTERKQIPFPWCAPECLRLRQFSSASDVWAFGVTIWELFTFGEHPWAGLENGAQILQAIDQEGKRLPKPRACPSELYNVMQSCWAHRKQDRPTFAMLSQFYSTVYLDEMKVVVPPKDDGTLTVQAEDRLTVIDGRPENHWWICQNQRTYQIGKIARRVLLPVYRKRASPTDISQPLRNSFVHAGHGDSDPKKSFGNPNCIDDLYLRNPVPPTDLLLNLDLDTPLPQNSISSLPPKSRNSVLVEFSDNFTLPPEIPRRNSWDQSQSFQYANSHVDLIDPDRPLYFNLPPQQPANSQPGIGDLLGSPSLIAPSSTTYYTFPENSQPEMKFTTGYYNFPEKTSVSTNPVQNPGVVASTGSNWKIPPTSVPSSSVFSDQKSASSDPSSAKKPQPEVRPTADCDWNQVRLPKPPRSSNIGRKERIIQTVPIPSLYTYSDVFDLAHNKANPSQVAVVPPFNVQPKSTSNLGTSSVLDDLTRSVLIQLPGESLESCQDALRRSHFDVEKSVKSLKVQRLLKLNVAPEEQCLKILTANQWDLERAGAALFGSGA